MITILMPTINRSEYVARALKYYARQKYDGVIMIGDSSDQSHATNIKQQIQKVQNTLHIEYHYFPSPPYINDAYCVADMVKKVKTPYVVYAGDDDFLVPETLCACIKYLDNNDEYTAAHGLRAEFSLDRSGPYGEMLFTRPLEELNLQSGSASARWAAYMRHPVSTQYYVHRRPIWEKMYAHVKETPSRYLGPELLPCSLSVISGKIAEIDQLSLLFQINQNRPFSWVTHSIFDLIEGSSWAESSKVLRGAVIHELVVTENITVPEATEIFEKEYWKHIMMFMKDQYIGKYLSNTRIEKILNKYDLNRTIKRVMGLDPKYSEGLGSRGCLALKNLLSASSKYHEQFMPIYDSVTKTN